MTRITEVQHSIFEGYASKSRSAARKGQLADGKATGGYR